MLDLLVLFISASDQSTVLVHVLALNALDTLLLVLQLQVDYPLLGVLEDHSMYFDDRVGFWHARTVAFVRARLLKVVLKEHQSLIFGLGSRITTVPDVLKHGRESPEKGAANDYGEHIRLVKVNIEFAERDPHVQLEAL